MRFGLFVSADDYMLRTLDGYILAIITETGFNYPLTVSMPDKVRTCRFDSKIRTVVVDQ